MNALRIALATVFATVAGNALCQSTATEWKWITGQTTPSGWDIKQGAAKVEIANGKLSVRLLEPKLPEGVAQTLQGRINRGRVVAVRKTMRSDVGDEKMTGSYEKGTMDYYTFETIIVSNQWGFVGITRTVKSDNLTPRSKADRPQAAGR